VATRITVNCKDGKIQARKLREMKWRKRKGGVYKDTRRIEWRGNEWKKENGSLKEGRSIREKKRWCGAEKKWNSELVMRNWGKDEGKNGVRRDWSINLIDKTQKASKRRQVKGLQENEGKD
jgi:hypothetical protein